ncbi:MAG: hypothetical protein WCQ23_06025 [Candidatus Methanomethylophilaceae archaeon]|jgi:hypothetical protein
MADKVKAHTDRTPTDKFVAAFPAIAFVIVAAMIAVVYILK